MICAPSNPQLQSQEEKFLSSYHKLKDVLKTGQVCPGMGATEIKVMRRLEEYQGKKQGKETQEIIPVDAC